VTGLPITEQRDPVKTAPDGRSVSAKNDEIPIAVSFDVLRPQINAIVTNNAVEMVQAMIAHAKEGQPQALKYLFEMIGLYPATSDEPSPQSRSLAQFLLKRLGIPEPPNALPVKREPMP
jgi:hypothetical protein